MSRMLLLTIDGPGRELDLELPGDIPVTNLLPLLAEICCSERFASWEVWTLVPKRTGADLAGARTLFDQDILDGDILILCQRGAVPGASTPVDLTAQTQRDIIPSEQTGWIGVSWQQTW